MSLAGSRIEVLDVTNKEPLLCKIPFNQILVDEKGDVYLCCGSHIQNISPVAGNLFQRDAIEIWNSEIFKTFRMSFVDGSLRYCNEKACSAAANKDKPEFRQMIHSIDEIVHDPALMSSNFSYYLNAPDRFDGSLAGGYPTRLYLGIDTSCNLKCPSCRDQLYMAERSSKRLDNLYGNLKSITPPGIEYLELDGAGDVFASSWYRKFLCNFPVNDFPKLNEILLRSNGILWTEKNWYRLHPYFRSKLIYACISIDAATASTYKKVRGGASFSTLVKNLHFIKRLKENGEINGLTFVMVYRKSNYHEIPAFIEMGNLFSACHLVIHPLQPWAESTYVLNGTYKHEAIHLESHPEHAEFKNFIKKNEIKKSTFVDFSW